MSLSEYSGLFGASSLVFSVAGVPVSVSWISVPCTLVVAVMFRSGSIRFGFAKSIEPPSCRR